MRNPLVHLFPDRIEAGVDEAGRGCLAGPVVAAAIILPPDFRHPLLNDSKQLSETQRDTLRPILEQEALAFAFGVCSVEEIEQLNILKASLLAMHRALDGLSVRPEAIAVDGNRFVPYPLIPHQCVVKGDGKIWSIAAASVLAKTHRDELMEALHNLHPEYGWERNKGYPTAAHRRAIAQFGANECHRKTFNLLGD
jgi:ribonuclease HII